MAMNKNELKTTLRSFYEDLNDFISQFDNTVIYDFLNIKYVIIDDESFYDFDVVDDKAISTPIDEWFHVYYSSDFSLDSETDMHVALFERRLRGMVRAEFNERMYGGMQIHFDASKADKMYGNCTCVIEEW